MPNKEYSYGVNQIFVGFPLAELEILRRYVDKPEREDGFHKDIFGTKARLSFFDSTDFHGVVQTDLPFPDNGRYGECVEYLGTLRGVQAAREKLIVYELGAGFAPWLIIAHAFSRRDPQIKRVRLAAVEADPARLRLIEQNFRDNGLPLPGEDHPTAETFIVNAAVSEAPGEISFLARDIYDWGGAANAAGTESEYRGVKAQAVVVPARRIDDLIRDESRVDLMHLDIQGAEAASIRASQEAIDAKVAAMVIGTHSRVIEGELISLLRNGRWLLLYEKPCRFDCQSRLPDLVGATQNDGTQVWINLPLWPDGFDWS
jgi:FkbM family methyltransferase